MSNTLKHFLLALPLLLTGCGDSLVGAYEAAIQYGDEDPRVVGIAVIQDNRIIADGSAVEVLEWKKDGDTITAMGKQGVRIAQFTRNDAGDLVQSLPNSRVIYKRYEL